MGSEQERFSWLTHHLWRGGSWAYFWHKRQDGSGTLWFPANRPPAVPHAWADADIYFGVHPTATRGRVDERATNDDIVTVNCLYADFDAKHFHSAAVSGQGVDIAAGKHRIEAHLEQMHVQGYPLPTAVVDSGGGYQGYWLLAQTLDITDANREQVRRVQAAWVHLWGADAGAKDLARILRVPGTVNHKPVYAPQFPTVTLVGHEPTRLYTWEQLVALLPTPISEQQPGPVEQDVGHCHGGPRAERYGAAALAREMEAVAHAPNGSRNSTLNTAAHNLGGLVSGGVLSAADVRAGLTSAALRSGLPADEVRKTIESGLAAGMRHPRSPMANGGTAHRRGHTQPDGTTATASGIPGGSAASMPTPPTSASSLDGSEPVSQRIARDLDTWGYRLWMNDMDDTVMVNDQPLSDAVEAEILLRARDAGYGRKTGNAPSLAALKDAILAISHRNRRHPVREYFDSLAWDGADHIGHLAGYVQDKNDLVVYADGSQRAQFHATLLRFLVGVIARTYGDERAMRGNAMLVLSSDGQGVGKSHFAEWLCPLPQLFIDSSIHPDDKDHRLRRAQVLIWEVGELGATTRRQDVEALKGFITAPCVQERRAYGRYDTRKPALAGYIGTINNDGGGFLRDTTGNRRFMVVDVESIDWGYADVVDRDQVWAQAVAAWRENPDAWRLSAEESRASRQTAEAHTVPDPLVEWLQKVAEACAPGDDVGVMASGYKCKSSDLLHALYEHTDMKKGSSNSDGRQLSMAAKSLWPWVQVKKSDGARVYYGVQLRPMFRGASDDG